MPYDVKLPDIGEGIAEGEIVRWLVKPGDAVKEDQPLVEVMTDKASVEIPSPRTGHIEALHAEEGQVVPVGTVIVSIAVAGASNAAAASGGAAGRAAPSAARAPPPRRAGARRGVPARSASPGAASAAASRKPCGVRRPPPRTSRSSPSATGARWPPPSRAPGRGPNRRGCPSPPSPPS